MRKFVLLGLGLALLLLCPAKARAQNYDLSWWAIAGGGETSAGGGYTLVGTIGQPEAGTLAGGDYTLVGGFTAALTLPAGLCGDANGDAQVNTIDAVLVLRVAVGLETLAASQFQNADTNHDNDVNVQDAIKILRIAVTLDPPC